MDSAVPSVRRDGDFLGECLRSLERAAAGFELKSVVPQELVRKEFEYLRLPTVRIFFFSRGCEKLK